MSWQAILAIGSGGFIGAVLRFYLNTLISSKFSHSFPYATLSINLIGSFIMGILIVYFMHSSIFSVHAKSFLSVGILGALTTYSTFAIESFLLFQSGSIFLALINVLSNAIGSVIMAGSGFYLAKSILLR